jgi:Ca2+-binding RTX toxin-like protein
LTPTHALVPASPAIDAATAGCSLQKTDQRGVLRPQDGNNDGIAQCDIGAFEVVRPGTVTCDGLPATKVGTTAANTISGTSGVDVIQGLGGNDIIKGLAGNDVLCGGPGSDQALGATGDDRLFGEADKDNLNGEAGFDRCDGGTATTDTWANCEQASNVP